MGIGSRIWPDDFVWGVATAAYQIEGAALAEGKGPSTWDTFCTRPGAVYQGHTGEVACDHYHRWRQDLDLLSELGVTAYRFSISWPRVLAAGRGAPNPAGLAFYDKLVDGLLTRGITPYVTLFHWDLPQALQDQGGFANPDSPRWFADYARLIGQHFAGRVRHYFTINEPHAFIEGGLRHGRHAPGFALPMAEVLRSAHHALLAHGRAVQVLRAEVPNAWIAFAPVLIAATPASESLADREAARQWTFERPTDQLRSSAFWMDPVYRGHYPQSALAVFGKDFPKVMPSDLETIASPLDAFAANVYDTVTVRAGEEGEPTIVPPPAGHPSTAFGWPVTPEGHYWGPLFAWERYRLPVVIAENGMSSRDWLALDGKVYDDNRVDFIETHLLELWRARQAGVPVQGYFHWSLLDNFEWNHGYRERFGLVHVDFETLARTPKASFHLYRQLIANQRSSPEPV